MHSHKAASEETEHTMKKFKPSRSLPVLQTQDSTETTETYETTNNFCIFSKLLDLHNEFERDTQGRGLKSNSFLLEKLVKRERLNTLILNLYPGNKGYSLAFRQTPRTDIQSDNTANMIETKQWPYEDDELLRYIDNEELPPFIIDLLEPQFSFLFYTGCIICEVRDYRQAYPSIKCDIHHVLLRPTLSSLLADINNITEDKDWGTDEKLQLESQLLLAQEPTLCLDPDNSLADSIFRINNQKQMWNTHQFHRAARKFSQVTVNRKRKFQFKQRHGLELYDYITRFKAKPKSLLLSPTSTLVGKTTAKKTVEELKPIPVPNLDLPLIAPPSTGVGINEFKTYPRPKETSDCLPQQIEEYILETDMPSKDKTKPRVYHIKLSIFQRPSNSEYLGELYLDRDHKENENNGVACRFSLGSRTNANRYIHQFTEIFTESGRKSVRIRHDFSPGYKERMANAQAQVQAQSAASTVQNNLVQQHINQLSQTLQIQQNQQNQTCVTAPMANGNPSLLAQSTITQSTNSMPILPNQIQGLPQVNKSISHQQAVSNQELEINALANTLMNSAQQFQAAANAKQQQAKQHQIQQQNQLQQHIQMQLQQQHSVAQQHSIPQQHTVTPQQIFQTTSQNQQQKLVQGNTAIIILLNSPNQVNNDTSAAMVNAINNSTLLPQQLQTINQKLFAKNMKIPTVTNARVINHNNLIALNNNRISLNNQITQQPQTITLTSGNFSNYTTTVPVKQQVLNQRLLTTNITNHHNSMDNNKALSALLIGTPAADRPDIASPNTNSLLLEKKLSAASTSGVSNQSTSTHYIQSPKSTQQQYIIQSPDGRHHHSNA